MAYIVVFAPLLAAIIAGLLQKQIGDRAAQILTTGGTILAALASVAVFVDVAFGGNARTIELATWMAIGGFEVNWAIKLDTLSAIMLVVITSVSSLVHVYSWGYMSHDPHRARFFAYLSLFTFAMLSLVTADNFIQMFFGWEGVGLASYLLIGFWYKKESANAAAIKAFVTNRVGDFGLALGVMAVFAVFGTVKFDEVFAQIPEMSDAVLTVFGMDFMALELIAFLLFIGAMGKSAQFFLHVWLPDAMEGPTPVSALIHAATMVTAGVFLVCRAFPIYEMAPNTSAFITFIGAITAIFAATVGVVQNDIKRVIAYSTCSQLGYMMFAIGVSAYGAAIFHLMTHAFFKALLFLGAGSVIHAMHEEQDMRKMGGIWRLVPWTYALMWIGSLALAGIGFFGIGFSGFYSKDLVLEAAFASHTWFGSFAFWLGIAAALMTAFYSWRLLILTFHGRPRADEKVMAHVHESSWVMLGPLVVLALGSVFAGGIAYSAFGGDAREAFWGEALLVLGADPIEEAHHVPTWVVLLPVVVGVIGIALAYVFYMYRPDLPGIVAARLRSVYTLLWNKWYFDDIYNAVLVRPAWLLGRGLWKGGDQTVIDGVGPDGIASATRAVARRASRLQTGYLYHYAFVMLIGVVVLVSWYLYSISG